MTFHAELHVLLMSSGWFKSGMKWLTPMHQPTNNRVINRSCCERIRLTVALGVRDHHLRANSLPSIPR
jgi:hypothetical protein